MITRNADYSIQHLRGLSTDAKPTDVPNGSEFREMDTGKKFLYSAAGTEWIEQPCCGGGSGGGGSVEPLIVEITDNNGRYTMNEKAVTVHNAFIGGSSVIFNYKETPDAITIYHPVIASVVSGMGLGGYSFYLSFPKPSTSNEIEFKKFEASLDNEFPSTSSGIT